MGGGRAAKWPLSSKSIAYSAGLIEIRENTGHRCDQTTEFKPSDYHSTDLTASDNKNNPRRRCLKRRRREEVEDGLGFDFWGVFAEVHERNVKTVEKEIGRAHV